MKNKDELRLPVNHKEKILIQKECTVNVKRLPKKWTGTEIAVNATTKVKLNPSNKTCDEFIGKIKTEDKSINISVEKELHSSCSQIKLDDNDIEIKEETLEFALNEDQSMKCKSTTEKALELKEGSTNQKKSLAQTPGTGTENDCSVLDVSPRRKRIKFCRQFSVDDKAESGSMSDIANRPSKENRSNTELEDVANDTESFKSLSKHVIQDISSSHRDAEDVTFTDIVKIPGIVPVSVNEKVQDRDAEKNSYDEIQKLKSEVAELKKIILQNLVRSQRRHKFAMKCISEMRKNVNFNRRLITRKNLKRKVPQLTTPSICSTNTVLNSSQANHSNDQFGKPDVPVNEDTNTLNSEVLMTKISINSSGELMASQLHQNKVLDQSDRVNDFLESRVTVAKALSKPSEKLEEPQIHGNVILESAELSHYQPLIASQERQRNPALNQSSTHLQNGVSEEGYRRPATNVVLSQECLENTQNRDVIITLEEANLEVLEVTPEDEFKILNQTDNETRSPSVKKLKAHRIKVCPYCDKKVKEISQHLKSHGFPDDERKILLNSLRVRKPYSGNRPGRLCPYFECQGQKPYPRLDLHLKRKHNLSSQDKLYTKFVRSHYDTTVRPIPKCVNEKTCPEYSSFSERAKDMFYSYLTSQSGGRVNNDIAKQHSYKIRQILNGIKLSSFDSLVTVDMVDRLEAWFVQYSEKCMNSSCQTYCSVFLLFLTFLSTCTIDDSKLIGYQRLKMKVTNWRKAFGKASKFEHPNTKDLKVSAEEIKFFLTSELHTFLVQTLVNFAVKPDNSMKFRCQMRNLLLIRAMFCNAYTFAELPKMRVIEFLRAKKVDDPITGEGYVISVSDHNTVGKDGPSTIVLPIPLHKLYLLYYTYLRSSFTLLPNDNVEGYFFTTSTGKHTSSDDVHKAINSIWKDAGLKSRISMTMFRKTSPTKVHGVINNEARNVVTPLTCYTNSSTAENSYKLKTQANRSLESFKDLPDTVIGLTEPNLDKQLDFENNIGEDRCVNAAAENYASGQVADQNGYYKDGSHMKESDNDTDMAAGSKAFSKIGSISQAKSLSKQSVKTTDVTLCEVSYLDRNSTKDVIEPTDVDKFHENKNHRGRCFFTDSQREIIRRSFLVNIQRLEIPAAKILRNKVENCTELKELQEQMHCEMKVFIVKIKGAIQNFVNKECKKR